MIAQPAASSTAVGDVEHAGRRRRSRGTRQGSRPVRRPIGRDDHRRATHEGRTGRGIARGRRHSEASARKRRSGDGNSMIAWATQSVTTSASVTLLAAFFGRCGRRSSAVTNTVVSSRSRSASIVASMVDGAYWAPPTSTLLRTNPRTRPPPWSGSQRRPHRAAAADWRWFPLAPIEPCMKFSLTRLTDILHLAGARHRGRVRRVVADRRSAPGAAASSRRRADAWPGGASRSSGQPLAV